MTWRVTSVRPFCKALREGLSGAFAPAEIVLHGRDKSNFAWGNPFPLASHVLTVDWC